MRAIVSNTIRVMEPTEYFKAWCQKNLTIPNPEYERKVRMNFWVGNTPKWISLYTVHGEDYILPFGTLRNVQALMTDIQADFPEIHLVDYGDPVPLYDYQEAAVERMHEGRFGILQSPAGSGKTQMGIALIKKWGRKALWLTHTMDLLNQSKERALRYTDEHMIGTITEGKVNIGTGITFATIQTMCRLDLSQYRDTWDVIIVDECHRVAGTPTSMTQFYKVLNALRARHKYGLSATVHRSDGMIAATYALLGSVVYAVPETDVADKIMQVGIHPVQTEAEITRDCLNTDGTICYSRLINHLCEDEGRNRLIADHILQNRDHPCLILSDRLQHLQRLMSLLPKDLQQKSVMISGKMVSKSGKALREQAIADMRNGEKQFLFATYSLAKEGLDVPRLQRLFLTTPQKDYAVVTQSIGRIARTCEGKCDPVAYDFVDNNRYLVNSYKKRCATYRKNRCYFVEEE